MKILATSDLHGNLPEITTPFDLLLICGDICPVWNHRLAYQGYWLRNDFYEWLTNLPRKDKFSEIVFIAGNHDLWFERSSERDIQNLIKDFPKYVKYLKHETYTFTHPEVGVVNIFGTPYCTQFGNWAFMKDPDTLKEKYLEIPEGTDIIISHQPPLLKYLGTILEMGAWNEGGECGNRDLAKRVKEVKPKMLFCGHIHSGDHNITRIEYEDGTFTQCANVSLVNEKYESVNKILEINYE